MDLVVDLWRGIKIPQQSSRKCFRLIFTLETQLGVFKTNLLSLLFLLLLPGNSSLFCSPKIIVTETCSRASTVVRLRSQNGLSPKMASHMSERFTGFFSSEDPLPYLFPFLQINLLSLLYPLSTGSQSTQYFPL